MTKIKDVAELLAKLAPPESAEEWDNCGLLVGNREAYVTAALTCLDVTDAMIAEAKAAGANLMVCHHPVIFHPVKQVLAGSLVHKLITEGISVIAAHTNFDAAPGGLADKLASVLELIGPETPNGSPYIRVGLLPRVMDARELAVYAAERLGSKEIKFVPVSNKSIKRVAVCPGEGGDFLSAAVNVRADAYITGEVKHHILLEAANIGITLVLAGHYDTEKFFAKLVADYLSVRLPDVRIARAKSDANPVEYL